MKKHLSRFPFKCLADASKGKASKGITTAIGAILAAAFFERKMASVMLRNSESTGIVFSSGSFLIRQVFVIWLKLIKKITSTEGRDLT